MKLLEGIKIHLALPQCVFVLGVNVLQLQRALAPQLPGASESNPQAEAAEYLEKLCNFTWKLPFPSTEQRSRLLDLWLQDPAGTDGRRTIRLPDALRQRLVAVAAECECLPANPRKVKGLANTIRQLAARAWPHPTQKRELAIPAESIHAEADALLIAASIDHFHPELLRYLQTYPGAWAELINWLNGKSELPSYSDLARVFADLQRSAVPSERGERRPTPASGPLVPIYPDPVHLSVFRIHRLLREATGSRSTVDKTSLSRYLRLAMEPPLAATPA